MIPRDQNNLFLGIRDIDDFVAFGSLHQHITDWPKSHYPQAFESDQANTATICAKVFPLFAIKNKVKLSFNDDAELIDFDSNGVEILDILYNRIKYSWLGYKFNDFKYIYDLFCQLDENEFETLFYPIIRDITYAREDEISMSEYSLLTLPKSISRTLADIIKSHVCASVFDAGLDLGTIALEFDKGIKYMNYRKVQEVSIISLILAMASKAECKFSVGKTKWSSMREFDAVICCLGEDRALYENHLAGDVLPTMITKQISRILNRKAGKKLTIAAISSYGLSCLPEATRKAIFDSKHLEYVIEFPSNTSCDYEIGEYFKMHSAHYNYWKGIKCLSFLVFDHTKEHCSTLFINLEKYLLEIDGNNPYALEENSNLISYYEKYFPDEVIKVDINKGEQFKYQLCSPIYSCISKPEENEVLVTMKDLGYCSYLNKTREIGRMVKFNENVIECSSSNLSDSHIVTSACRYSDERLFVQLGRKISFAIVNPDLLEGESYLVDGIYGFSFPKSSQLTSLEYLAYVLKYRCPIFTIWQKMKWALPFIDDCDFFQNFQIPILKDASEQREYVKRCIVKEAGNINKPINVALGGNNKEISLDFNISHYVSASELGNALLGNKNVIDAVILCDDLFLDDKDNNGNGTYDGLDKAMEFKNLYPQIPFYILSGIPVEKLNIKEWKLKEFGRNNVFFPKSDNIIDILEKRIRHDVVNDDFYEDYPEAFTAARWIDSAYGFDIELTIRKFLYDKRCERPYNELRIRAENIVSILKKVNAVPNIDPGSVARLLKEGAYKDSTKKTYYKMMANWKNERYIPKGTADHLIAVFDFGNQGSHDTYDSIHGRKVMIHGFLEFIEWFYNSHELFNKTLDGLWSSEPSK